MKRCRFLYVTLALLCLSTQHPLPSCSAQLAVHAASETATVNGQMRWAFRALSPVTVTSPIIRLQDVVKPLDPNMPAWQRLRRSPIGLVPLGGQAMSIQRDRLAKAIRDAEATPREIDWIGPTKIKIVYREADPAVAGDHTAIAQVDYANSPVPINQAAPLTASETARILHWIDLAIDRQLPSIAETYDVQIDRRQAGLAPLRSIAGVTSIQLDGRAREGTCRFHVVARSADGRVESNIQVVLTEHPRVVVPRKSLSRGHRIERGDLITKSMPEEDIEQGVVIDPEELIGMEVRDAVRANRPIFYSDVGSPILVHRGDLIEIRVVGGGITITTNAKSLRDGAASDLVEVETLQPRKRFVARVVQPGLVEIITRAPRVKP